MFDEVYEKWLADQINEEKSPRRRELLQKGLGHGTIEFLRWIWFPVIGNLNDLYPEYEVRDYNNGYRYLDLAYMLKERKAALKFTDIALMLEISK